MSKPLESLLRGWSSLAPSEKGSFRLVRAVRRCIPRDQWRRRFRLPNGVDMDLNLATYPDCCMAYGLYELTTARLIRQLLGPGDHFVDGGANIGYFTMLAAQCVGTQGRVDAFEPEPHNRKRLLDHLEHNGLTQRIHIHPQALADTARQTTIHFFPEDDPTHNHGCSSLFVQPNDKTIASPVDTIRMDEKLANAVPHLIKLDLEGAEPLAITGMENLLTSPTPPMILGEVNPAQSKIAKTSPAEWVARALKIQPQYAVYSIGIRLKPFDLSQAPKKLGQMNVLLRCKPA